MKLGMDDLMTLDNLGLRGKERRAEYLRRREVARLKHRAQRRALSEHAERIAEMKITWLITKGKKAKS